MTNCDLLSCSSMVATSNELSFNLSMEYAPKLGAVGKYFQFISMNKSIANWNYLFAGIEQGLIQQSTSTSSQSYSHSRDRFFKKKKKKKIIMNKSSSLLLHLHLHLLHFLIMKKSSYFKKIYIYIYINSL